MFLGVFEVDFRRFSWQINAFCLVTFHGEALLILAFYKRHFTTIKCSLGFALLLEGSSGAKLQLGNGKTFNPSLFDKSIFLMCLHATAHATNKKMGDSASPFFPL